MAFPSPPPAPQRGDRTTFSNRVDAFLTWLTNLIPQMNTFLSSLTTLAAGGANAFAYTFDTSIADSDPGNGKVRFGSTTQNAANVIRVDNLAGNGGDVTAFLTAMQAGTSNVKASLRLQKLSDVTSYLLFDITTITVATGYINLTVTPRTSSATSPFAANDTLILFFDPKGDKGDGGGTPTQQQIRDAIGTLGLANGGTGATTAAAALANLGGLPLIGGNVSGPIILNNAITIASKDTGGTARTILALGSDNNLNLQNGPGGSTRIYKSDGSGFIFQVNDTGDVVPTGALMMGNARPVRARDAGGNYRDIFYIGADNFLNYFGIGNATRWWNGAANAVVMTLSDNGVVTATSFTSTSDERKKTNWRRLSDAQLDALAALEDVGLFDWIDGSGTALGGRAQDIKRIVPQVVHSNPDGSLSVDYAALAFVMAQSEMYRAREAA